jgi:hypothetical protein
MSEKLKIILVERFVWKSSKAKRKYFKWPQMPSSTSSVWGEALLGMLVPITCAKKDHTFV